MWTVLMWAGIVLWGILGGLGITAAIASLCIEMKQVREEGFATKEKRQEMRESWKVLFWSIFLPLLVPVGIGWVLREGYRSLQLSFGKYEVDDKELSNDR